MYSVYHANPVDVQTALTDFSMRFDAAFTVADVPQWIGIIGDVYDTDALKVTYPIPVSAAGYVERKGDDKFRQLYERSLSMTTVQWQDGVEAKARLIEQGGEFLGWNREPERMAAEASRHPNILVADLLASNPLLDFYREEFPGGAVASTIRLFASNHPYNVFDTGVGTFSNDWGAGDTVQGETLTANIDATLIKALAKHFRAVKGPNGRELGLEFAGLLVPAIQVEDAKDAFERDRIVQVVQNVAAAENVAAVTMPNRFVGTNVMAANELTGHLPSGATGDPDTIYAYATKGADTPPPWIVQRRDVIEEIAFDKDSDYYKRTGKIAVSRILEMAATACLPHAIVRIDLSP